MQKYLRILRYTKESSILPHVVTDDTQKYEDEQLQNEGNHQETTASGIVFFTRQNLHPSPDFNREPPTVPNELPATNSPPPCPYMRESVGHRINRRLIAHSKFHSKLR